MQDFRVVSNWHSSRDLSESTYKRYGYTGEESRQHEFDDFNQKAHSLLPRLHIDTLGIYSKSRCGERDLNVIP